MTLSELVSTTRDTLTVKRVFAEPLEKGDVTVIAAASIRGAGGGGGGHDAEGQEGEGGGFALTARPAGAYLVKDGAVSWRPAVDVNRLVATLGVVAVVYLVTRSRVQRARLKVKALEHLTRPGAAGRRARRRMRHAPGANDAG